MNISIIKYKLRRGTKAQQLATKLDQGELGYTIDTKRVFVGTGTLSGGTVVGNKVHPPLTNYASLSNCIAEVGDLVVANNLFYQLTAQDYSSINSWRYVGASINASTFEFNAANAITIKNASISASHLDPNTITNGIKVDSGLLKLSYNTTSLELSSNELSIKAGGITEREINASALGDGIAGGSGTPILLDIDTNYFIFNSGKLSLSAIPSNSITFSSLNSNWIGKGLNYDLVNSKIYSTVSNIDTSTLSLDISGNVGLQSIVAPLTSEMTYAEVDIYGRVVNQQSSIFDLLTGNSTLNSSSSLSSIFNGTPAHTLSGAIPGLAVTKFEAISAYNGSTVTLTLTSAGFIVFSGNNNSRLDGKYIGRYAIPIFAY